jgi:hypothetical protein
LGAIYFDLSPNLSPFRREALNLNTARLSLKNNSGVGVGVGWVEERNPTKPWKCWVTLKFNPTYKSPKPTQYCFESYSPSLAGKGLGVRSVF